jgi:RimJ/RimL family protein N-acetyltransferase
MRDPTFTEIETERLRLRRFRARDVTAFHTYRADPAVARFQSWQDYSHEQAAAFVAGMARADPGVVGEPFQIAVARLADDELVGDCMLALDASDPPIAEVGYTIAPAHQGRGYAVEAVVAVFDLAFTRYGAGSARAVTDTRNVASIAVAERLGMSLVGTLRTTFKRQPCDEHTYELARSEWDTRRGA